MTLIYLILLTLYLVMGVKLCKIREENRFQYELSPRLILVISYYMYSTAMPISRLFFASTAKSDYDNEYMIVQLLGASGIIIGLYYFQKYRIRFTSNRRSKQASRIFLPLPAIIIMSATVGIVMFGAMKGLEWNLSAILKPYGYEATLGTGTQEQTLFGQILWMFAISSTVLVFIGAYNTKNNKLILFSLLVGGLFGMFFMIRGSRMMAGLMIITLACAYFFSKPLKIKYLLLSCVCIYLVVYTIGAIRDVGFALLAEAPIEIQMFDPLRQELGTNHNVFSLWKEMEKDKSLLLGKSYTIDVLYLMVPSYFWPARPVGLSVQFAMDYYGVSNVAELTSAWGFSPIVEALMNFGRLGIVPVFALFSFLISFLESWCKRQGAWGVSCYAFMIPIVINWNRIDMAVALKMFIIFLVVSKVFATVIYPKKSTLYKIRSTSIHGQI